MRAVHDSLKAEVGDKTTPLEHKWLLEHLKVNDWWVRKEQAPHMIQLLKSKRRSPTTYAEVDQNLKADRQNNAYYRSIKVWIPELMFGGQCRPCCPTCKRDNDVICWGFNKQNIGRMIVSLKENYFVLTHRYKCNACQKEKNAWRPLRH